MAAAACSCSFVVEDRAVFAQIPAASQLHRLKIGSVRPSGQCTDSCSGPILVYAAGGTGQIDAETVFEFEGKFYKNKEVFVVVGDKAGGFEFRNPPSFVTLENPRERDAHAEVDSLLDHLFYHNNTAPFIAYRLIQRFGVSNPSPAYVQAVAQAFKTGQYNGRVYSGATRGKQQSFSYDMAQRCCPSCAKNKHCGTQSLFLIVLRHMGTSAPLRQRCCSSPKPSPSVPRPDLSGSRS